MPMLVRISKPKPFLLYSEWDDGFSAAISLETLRKECPCADCDQDYLNKKTNKFSGLFATYKEGMYTLKALHKTGNYALNAEWEDGHDTGIYTFEKLREIFEKFSLSEEDIEKLEEKQNKPSPPGLNVIQ